MSCGIYKITNINNGFFYLGSSKKIKKRWSQHRYHLKKNNHHSAFLQKAWNKYGEKSFKFEIVEKTTEKKLLLREQYYLNNLQPWKNTIGYNLSKTACGGDQISNHFRKKEIIKKIKKSLSAIINELTPEQRKEKWARFGEKNFNWRGGSSKNFICPICGKETKNKKKQTKTCKDCRNRKGKNNSFFGKKHKKETIEKLKAAGIRRGNSFNTQKIKVKINGKIYSSFSKAAKNLNCCHTTIKNRINNPKFPNYKLIK